MSPQNQDINPNPMNILTQTDPTFLLAELTRLQSGERPMRIRDVAKQIGVSEAQLLACQIPTGKVRRLNIQGREKDFLEKLPELGKIMALTRNDACVLEHNGTIDQVSVVHGNIGLVIGPIELRLFLSAWRTAFQVESISRGKPLHSIQIFDAEGTAIIKFFLKDESNTFAFEQLTESLVAIDQAPAQEVQAIPLENHAPASSEALLPDWRAMQDTHDFHMILRKHKAHRLEAIDAVQGEFSAVIPNKDSVLRALEVAAKTQLPIMLFAGNRGSIQIHQDVIHNVKVLDQWYNVMDDNFNMHLDTSQIDAIRLVRKPTSDGIVTSLELFDQNRELALQIFGYRKPGSPENEHWRSLAESLLSE